MVADAEYPNIGHFLTVNDWENAVKLLNAQIEMRETNKHFNRLSMIYYSNLPELYKTKIQTNHYFESYIKNNLFYGLQKEFQVISYTVPKGVLGIRNHKFFSYSMRLLYYSIGIYLLRVSQEFVTRYNSREFDERSGSKSRLHCFYGGKLSYSSKENISFSSDAIYWRDSYDEYKKFLDEYKDKYDLILKLDMQNYFDEISISTILKNLSENIKPKLRKNQNYDVKTIEQINYLFTYLMNSSKGIPQAENDIIGNFIGFLHTLFVCFSIEEILSNSKDIESFQIVSYVDDISIFLKFKSPNKPKRLNTTINIGHIISDKLFLDFGVRFSNTKNKIHETDNEDDMEKFFLETKRSQSDEEIDEDINEDTQKTSMEKRFENVIEVVNLLKKNGIGKKFNFDLGEIENPDIIIKDMYSKNLNQFIDNEKRPENIEILEDLFRDFDFNLVLFSSLPLIIMICKTKIAKQKFEEFLLNNDEITTPISQFIVFYLCQVGLVDKKDFLELLMRNTFFAEIVKLLNNQYEIDLDDSGYYNIPRYLVNKLGTYPSTIEQIQHRSISEKIGSYSVALSHLLNEIHSLCYETDNKKEKGEYREPGVVNYLQKIGVPILQVAKISNLFERRNINLVSHPTIHESIASSVTKDEYEHYKKYVGLCIKKILESLPEKITPPLSQHPE